MKFILCAYRLFCIYTRKLKHYISLGKVFTDRANVAMGNVSVRISGTQKGIVTNSFGNFEIKDLKQRKYTIMIFCCSLCHANNSFVRNTLVKMENGNFFSTNSIKKFCKVS